MKKLLALILTNLNIMNAIAEIPLVPYQSPLDRGLETSRKMMELSMMQEQILTMKKQRELMNVSQNNEQSVSEVSDNEMPIENSGLMNLSESALAQILKITGSTYQYSKESLTVKVNQTKVIEMVPTALSYGFYKTGATESLLLSHPTLASELSALFAIRSIASYVYSSYPEANIIHVKVYLKHPNIHGVDTENLLYSMDMKKDVMNSIDWNQVGLLNIPNIFQNFHSSDWRKKILSEELNL